MFDNSHSKWHASRENVIKRAIFILCFFAVLYVSNIAYASPTDSSSWMKNFPERYAKQVDSEKYLAAKFLVDNMYHCELSGKVINCDAKLDSVVFASDQNYWKLIKGHTAEEQETDPLHAAIKKWAISSAKRLSQIEFEEPEALVDDIPDSIGIDEAFLRTHLDHAFYLREHDIQVKNMSFPDFCAYILPYRAIENYPLVSNSAELYNVFGKYMNLYHNCSSVDIAAGYNRTLWWLRKAGGDYPFDTMLGWKELFFGKFHDCVDKAYYATQIFRSCGIPAMIEYNIARRFNTNRHYMTAFRDNQGIWHSFSPESETTANEEDCFRKSLNIYREHYEALPSSPAKLKNETELVPPSLSSPGIEDVSSNYLQPTEFHLAISDSIPSENHLVYLATFAPYGEGLIPVTWGEVRGDSAVFGNVILDEVYFPVFYDADRRLKPFADPFLIEADSISTYHIVQVCQNTNDYVAATLTRKYPQKPSERKDAENAVGTIVLGSMTKDFATADTLATIGTIPDEEWITLPLATENSYQFYRVQAPSHDPHIHLGEIQFYYDDTRIMDEPIEKCKWKAEYDGKVNTAPDKWPHVTLSLTSPAQVNNIRYIVKNADNRLKTGHEYKLKVWGKGGWTELGSYRAEDNKISGLSIESGRLYWISDMNGNNTDELPYVIDENGNETNPYQTIMEKYNL